MQEITTCLFSDHLTTVSQELVKCLSMNTSVEAVNVLTLNFSKLEVKISKMETDVKGAMKMSSTAGNWCDYLHKQLKDVQKRVNK